MFKIFIILIFVIHSWIGKEMIESIDKHIKVMKFIKQKKK